MKNSEKILTLAVVLSLAALLNVAPALAREAESGGGANSGGNGGGGFDSARDIAERGAGATASPNATPGFDDNGRNSGFDSARDIAERGAGATPSGTPGFDDNGRNSGFDSARDILERGGAFNTNLNVGHRNDDVRRLQNRLKDDGVYSGPVTGYYGELTKKAVIEFQRRHGLPESGVVGKSTRDELNRGRGGLDDSTSRGRGNGADDGLSQEVRDLLSKLMELLSLR